MYKIALTLLMSLPLSSMALDKAIYGKDSRLDINDSLSSVHKTLGKSVAAMIPRYAAIPDFLATTTSAYTTEFMSISLAENRDVCDSDRYAHQQAVATCTGFLVSPTHLVTAGHCVKTMDDCQDNFWVFDYKLKTEKASNVGAIANSAIYQCKKIVATKLTVFTKQDWAVIELDRPVKDRAPLKLSKNSPSKNDAVFVIGTPSGTPLKVATGKTRSKHFNYFKTNLDTFGGNSGSPVFDAQNEVAGILVRGDVDYEAAGRCVSATYYGENTGRGEDVSYIKPVRSLLKL